MHSIFHSACLATLHLSTIAAAEALQATKDQLRPDFRVVSPDAYQLQQPLSLQQPYLAEPMGQPDHGRYGKLCGEACLYQTDVLKWRSCEPGVFFADCRLANVDHLGTLALCVDEYCQDVPQAWNQTVYVSFASQQLKDSAATNFDAILANASLHQVEQPQDLSQLMTAPFTMTPRTYGIAHRSTWALYGPHYIYPPYFGGVIHMVALAFTIFAALRHHFFRRRRRGYRCPDDQVSAIEGPGSIKSPDAVTRGSKILQRYFWFPALFGQATAHRPSVLGFSFSIPTVDQALVLAVYIGLNAMGCLYGLDPFRENILFDSPTVYTTKLLGDSTGIMTLFQMPLMLLCSSRNNLLLHFTGVPFSTFNFFHRWIGRVIIVESILHSVLYTYRLMFQKQNYFYHIHSGWLICGVIATVSCSLMLGQAVHLARKYGYELFLAAHILLSVGFFAGLWYHLDWRGYFMVLSWDSYLSWILAAVVIWLADRLLRLAWMLRNNLKLTGKSGFVTTRAQTREIAPGLFEISVCLARDWTFLPGQYCFIHLPSGWSWLQSHPFSIFDYATPSMFEDSHEEQPNNKPVLKIVLKAREGITASLPALEQLSDFPLLVDGPYGHTEPLPLDLYDNVTFVAGGTGLAGVFSHVKELAGKALHRNLHLILILRAEEEFEGLLGYLESLAPAVRISTAITRPSGTGSRRSSDEGSHRRLLGESEIKPAMGHRPDIPALLESDSQNAGSLAIVACGPGKLLDTCRATARDLLLTKREHLDLFIEAFEW